MFSQLLGNGNVVPCRFEMAFGLSYWEIRYRRNVIPFSGIVVVTQSLFLASRIGWVGCGIDLNMILEAFQVHFGILSGIEGFIDLFHIVGYVQFHQGVVS